MITPTVAAAKIHSRVYSNQLSVSRAGHLGRKSARGALKRFGAVHWSAVGHKLPNPMRAGMSVGGES
jgi:hypothetical protein